MDNSIYEVDREDYKTFVGQLNPETTHIEETWMEPFHMVKIKSNKNNTYLCCRVSDAEFEEEHYFIFNYPQDDEYLPPKPICKIHLKTKEEVQALFDALSALSRGE